MARAGGIILTLEDFADLSKAVPLLTRIYPNGSADVNHFTAAGGTGFLIRSLLGAGLLHPGAKTVAISMAKSSRSVSRLRRASMNRFCARRKIRFPAMAA